MERGRVLLCCWLTVWAVLGGTTAAWGYRWAITPAVEVKGQYLNNIYNSPRLRKSDYLVYGRPSLALNYESETTKFGGTFALLGMHYFQNDSLDRINQYYNINGSYKATPRLGLQLATSFITDSTATEELIASGTVINRTTRTSFFAAPSLSYLLTERWSTSLQYGFQMVDYQQLGYNNYENHTIVHGFDYLLSDKTSLLTRLTASYYKYSIDNAFTSLGPQIGFSYKYLEKWDMTFLGGLNISRIKSSTRVLAADTFTGFLVVRQQPLIRRTTNPFFSLGTNYRWQTGTMGLSYSRSLSANAYGGQSQYNNFNLTINQNMTEKFSLSLNPYFYTSSIDDPRSDYSSYYYGIRPGLSYKITDKFTMGASYNFAYRQVKGTSKYSYPINDVMLTLTYSYPTFY